MISSIKGIGYVSNKPLFLLYKCYMYHNTKNPKLKILYLVSIFLCKILCTLLSLKRKSFQLAIQRSFRGHK